MTTTSIELNNGVSIPQLGYGVFQVPPDETQAAVEAALEAGYRHIDTAAAYNNEAGVGAGVKATGIPRDEIFITTKLRNGDQGSNETRAAFERSNKTLGLGYIDLYLIHWPVPVKDLYIQSWRVMERLYDEKAVRAIGVSNFLTAHLDRLIAATDIVPVVDQIEVHPSFDQGPLTEYVRSRGVAVEAYSPLGQSVDLHAAVVSELADKYQVTPAQVILRWHMQRENIAIPKSVDRDHMRSNLDIFEFKLTADDLDQISALKTAARIGNDPNTFALSQIR